MHPILRIFHYQTDASLSVLGQCGSYDQGGGLSTIRICEHDEVPTLVGECAYGIVHRQRCDDHHSGQYESLDKRVFHFRYLLRMYCAYINRPAVTAMTK